MKHLDPNAIPLSGTQLIEASAGTGKTYTITSLFLRLVLAGYTVNEILVVTFTEAATAELRDRLRSRLREALAALADGEGDDFLAALVAAIPESERPAARRRIQAALSGFDEAAVMTIHGFCRRMLLENAFESGVLFDAELLIDPQPLYEEIAADYWAVNVYDLPMAWVRYLREQGMGPRELARLTRETAGHPDRKILPEAVTADDATAVFEASYQETRRLWKTEGAEITRLLQTHKGVNRRSYNKPNLKRWLDNVADYLSDPIPRRLPGETDLFKFTRSRLAETAQKVKNRPEPPVHPFFDLCDTLCGIGDAWLLSFQRRFVDYAVTELARRKRDHAIQFFDDLIQDLDRALAGPGGPVLAEGIRGRFRAALIDEFQDTDQAQYRIFRGVYQGKPCPFFLIGDPKQSIYAFRGADIFAYLGAVADAGDAAHSLDINWRSDPSLIRAVNSLFGANRISRPFGFQEISYTPVTPREGATDRLVIDGRTRPPFQLLFVERDGNTDRKSGLIKKEWIDANLPGRVAADICRLLGAGAIRSEEQTTPLGPGDIAVLVRTNHQAREMQGALRQAGLPCVITSGDSVFLSAEAFELWQVLLAVADPADDTRIANALATDLVGLSGNQIAACLSGDPVWEWWVLRFRDWHRQWHEGGFIQMLQRVFNTRSPGESEPLLLGLLSLADGERRVTNFQHLAELLHAATARDHLGPAGLIRWFGNQRSGQGESSNEYEVRLESDVQAVQVVTIHKSKGLEYPVVYAPYLWDGKLHNAQRPPAVCHDPRDGNRAVFDLGSDRLDAHLARAGVEEMAENLRLLYVALTRARHACRVVWGAVNHFNTSALGYLLHSPGDMSEFSDVAHHVRGLDDEEMRADLGSLAEIAPGAFEIRDLEAADDTRYAAPRGDIPALACHPYHNVARRRWRVESFSSLVADAARETTPEEEVGVDHDQRADGPVQRSMDGDIPALNGANRVPLADFSRGANAGTFFHAIYEHMNFTISDPQAVDVLVAEQLAGHGFDAAEWRETVSRSVFATLGCPLDPGVKGLALNQLTDPQRFNELEFVFPVARNAKGDKRATARRLSTLFAAHAGPVVPPAYARRISQLRFPAIQGFLKGFIDMVFEFQGKWYLVDYKSNYLGDHFNDYGQGAIARTMADHHYFLQYHLYAVALHRYLSYRLPDYHYDTHFGGTYYLFIRGMSTETGADFGVFRDRPSRAFIEALSGMFEGQGGGK